MNVQAAQKLVSNFVIFVNCKGFHFWSFMIL